MSETRQGMRRLWFASQRRLRRKSVLLLHPEDTIFNRFPVRMNTVALLYEFITLKELLF